MPFDLHALLAEHQGRQFDLFARHVNPQWARVLRTIGYDRRYVRAEGSCLFDDQGRRVLDFMGGYAVCNVGRNHPTVQRALQDYLALEGASMVQFDAPLLAGVLARELLARAQLDLEFAFFCNSGTEGVEAAIKMARCATGRSGLVFADRAFHGLTMGSLSLNGCESFREGFGSLLSDCQRVPFGDLVALERALASQPVAAFVVEPVQGKGVYPAPEGYLAEAARLCHRSGALLVVDEVQTGVGRTGAFLGVHHDRECDPDMVVMSKALSGGYVPVGAVLVRGSVWRATFSSMDRAIVHSSTFHMGGLAMTAALAVLAVYDDLRLGERSAAMGARLLAGLEGLRDRHELVRAVRGRGLMAALEFGEPRSLGLRASWRLMNAVNPDLFAQAALMPLFEDCGVLCQVAGHGQPTLKFTPPLVVTEAEVDEVLGALEAVVASLHRLPGPILGLAQRLGRNTFGRRSYEEGEACSVAAVSPSGPSSAAALR